MRKPLLVAAGAVVVTGVAVGVLINNAAAPSLPSDKDRSSMTDDPSAPEVDWNETDPEEPIIDGPPPQTIDGMARDSLAGQNPDAKFQDVGGKGSTLDLTAEVEHPPEGR